MSLRDVPTAVSAFADSSCSRDRCRNHCAAGGVEDASGTGADRLQTELVGNLPSVTEGWRHVQLVTLLLAGLNHGECCAPVPEYAVELHAMNLEHLSDAQLCW